MSLFLKSTLKYMYYVMRYNSEVEKAETSFCMALNRNKCGPFKISFYGQAVRIKNE